MKKIIALFLSLILLLSLAACGKSPDSDAPSEAPAADSPVPEASDEKPSEIPEPSEEREHVTLRFFARNTEQPGEAAVFAAFNEYCEEKLNTTVEWHFLGGTFSDKVAVMINSGEQYDAVWTSNWQNDYATNVSRGAYVDLTDMLNDYPDLVNAMPSGFWDAAKIGGRIYAVPCQQIAARTPGVVTNLEYAEAYGLDAEAQSKLHNYTDFEDYLQFCKDNYGAMAAPIEEACIDLYCGYEFLNGQASAVAIKSDDESCTVVNFYATEEFRSLCEEMSYLHDKGLLDPGSYNDENYKRTELISGRCSFMETGTYKPGGSRDLSNTYGIPLQQTAHDVPLMTTGSIIATLWAVSTTSDHPDRALEVLAMLSTDPYAMQLISWGIEGIHYTLDEDGCMILAEDSDYNPSQSWALGNVFLTRPLQGMDPDVYEQTAEVNASANTSKLIGFTPDILPVEAEITNVTAAFEEYKVILSGSVPVEETLIEFNEKLDAAGIDALIAEMQTQVDAFLASK